MHPTNQRLRRPDKLSQGAHSETSYPKVQWENTLDKRGHRERERAGEREQKREERRSNKEAESKKQRGT